MAHTEQRNFCKYVADKHPSFFTKVRVLDVGSLDVNGNNRWLFTDVLYTGIDVDNGPNVDIVSKGHEYNAPDGFFDTIISTECFEHDMFYKETLLNIVRLVRPGGMFLFTCASTGRPEHGTRTHDKGSAPLLKGEWEDYYKNLAEEDIREVLNVDEIFSEYEFGVNHNSKDLYFYGIKKPL
jgi:SAM-dependent methyltransferase